MTPSSVPIEQFYVVGGTLDPDSPSYVERRADAELLNALKAGDLCHVLSSRQMGKSSLMARTALRLTAEGYRCAIVDISLFSEKKGRPEDWYYALVDHIADRLCLKFRTSDWWAANLRLAPLARMTKFLDKVVLGNSVGNVVIFIDEIDSTIRLPFSDDFFAAIRACFNARATAPHFNRLHFALLGVATPAQLIRDTTRTPFNVGRGIELSDFTQAEAAPLAFGLHRDRDRAADLLRRVLDWTDGHPYLTQTLCWHLVKNSTWDIDELVGEIFLSKRAAREETNLRLVSDRLTQGGVELADVLRIYSNIVTGGFVRDEPTSPVHTALRLSGVVKTASNGELKVRNRIYQRVFSAEWAASEMPVKSPQLSTSQPELEEAYTTYDTLRRLPDFRRNATSILARFYELRGMRDEALLLRIRALQENPSERKRKLVQVLIDEDYRQLIASFVHDAPINAAVLSPNGNRVLTGGQDGLVRVWSTFSFDMMLRPLQHGSTVTTVAFSPDGKWIASGGEDYNAYIWDADTGERSAPLSHKARVRHVVFSADSQRLLTTSSDGTAAIWNVNADPGPIVMFRHLDSIRMGAFSPDGKTVATASQDRTVMLWPANSEGQFGCALLHGGGVTILGFHSVEPLLITCCEDGLVRLWDLRSQDLLGTLIHNGPVLDFALSPDGTRIATASEDRTARIWQLEHPYREISQLRHHEIVTTVAYTPDGEFILSGSADRNLRVWSATDGEPCGFAYRHSGSVLSVACSAGGNRVLSVGQEGGARLWRFSASKRDSAVTFRHAAVISCASSSPNGEAIAVGDLSGAVWIWRLRGSNAECVCLDHPSPISAVTFSPDSANIAIACEDGSISLANSSGERLGFSARHDGPVRALLFSPQGNLLAAGGDKRATGLWHLNSAQSASTFQLGGLVLSLAFSHDGKLLATGGSDRTARVWSVDEGKELGLQLAHATAVTTIAYDSHADMWLSGSGKTIHLWRLQRVWRLEELAFECDPAVFYTLKFGNLVEFVSFAPDGGRFLVVAESWLHYFSVDEDGAVPITSRLLPGTWMGAFRWCDPDAIEVGLLDTADRFRVSTLRLDPPEVSPVEGDIEKLLSEWETRLHQHIDENARITPGF